ncbi:MAG: response regulator [Gammaproteobacteria bacterium]|nr:response regulator [Gammaproteobacteria bacterium]
MGSRLELESAPGAGSTTRLRAGSAPEHPLPRPPTAAPPGSRSRPWPVCSRRQTASTSSWHWSSSSPPAIVAEPTGVLEQVAKPSSMPSSSNTAMPSLDGIEACRRLRRLEFGRTTPVIAVTADVVGDGILRAREAGFDGHVLKPISRGRPWRLIPALLLPAAEAPPPMPCCPWILCRPCPAWTWRGPAQPPQRPQRSADPAAGRTPRLRRRRAS